MDKIDSNKIREDLRFILQNTQQVLDRFQKLQEKKLATELQKINKLVKNERKR